MFLLYFKDLNLLPNLLFTNSDFTCFLCKGCIIYKVMRACCYIIYLYFQYFISSFQWKGILDYRYLAAEGRTSKTVRFILGDNFLSTNSLFSIHVKIIFFPRYVRLWVKTLCNINKIPFPLKCVVGGPKFKMQCCDRAKSEGCRNWCKDLHHMYRFKSALSSIDNDYLRCIQNPNEEALSTCLTDGNLYPIILPTIVHFFLLV